MIDAPKDQTGPDAAARPDAAPQKLDRGSALVIGLLLSSAFVVMLNELSMGVALPVIMADLGITPAVGQWLTTAFLLTMAVVIPITGWLLQRLNTRPVFLSAISVFLLGTVTAASSPIFELLVAGRVLQAVGTAIMMPLLMTTIMNLVPPQQRGRIMGLISVVMAVAPALGPTVSGVLVTSWGWRAALWYVVPIAIVSLVLGALWLKNVAELRPAKLDLLSALLSIAGFGGLVYGISTIGDALSPGEGRPVGAVDEAGITTGGIALAVGVVALALFIWRQIVLQREDRAMLDLRTFRARSFAAATITLVIASIAMFGSFLILPIYMQTVLELSPLEAGMMLLPGSILQGALGPIIGRRYDRVGPRPLLVPGTIGLLVVFIVFANFGENTPIWLVLIVQIFYSVTLAHIFTPIMTAALGALPKHLYSHGSATISTLQQVGGATGSALLAGVYTVVSGIAIAGGAAQHAGEAAGMRMAFVIGIPLVVIAMVAAWFVQREDAPVGAPEAAHGEPALVH